MSVNDDEQQTKQESRAKSPAYQGEVLLVAGSGANQHPISQYIAATGASATLVENAPQAIEQTLSRDFDLLLVDIDSPAIDAKELLKGLLQLGFDTPVYGLTNRSALHDIQEYLLVGFKGIFDFQSDLTQLKAALKRYLSSPEPKVTAESELSAKLNAKIAQFKPMFLATLRTQYHQLCEDIEKRDYVQISKILHIVKGSAGNFGYKTLTDIANDALISLRLEQFDEAPSLIAKVIICIDKILRSEECSDTKN